MTKKPKRRGKGKTKFIMIDGYVKRCPAWKSLTPVERNAYIEVKWRYDGMNNGRIGLGCRELAEELSMSRNTADRALQNLVSVGFIAVAKPSAFHVKNRAATEWRLTEYRCDVTGNLPSKDFMRWEPTKKQQSHPRDTQSRGWDCDAKTDPSKSSDSPTHGTVKPVFPISQSHPRDTYRSTIPSSKLEEGLTRLGELVQPQTKGEASKLTGRRSRAQREVSKEFFSRAEARRASARKAAEEKEQRQELLISTIMGGAR